MYVLTQHLDITATVDLHVLDSPNKRCLVLNSPFVTTEATGFRVLTNRGWEIYLLESLATEECPNSKDLQFVRLDWDFVEKLMKSVDAVLYCVPRQGMAKRPVYTRLAAFILGYVCALKKPVYLYRAEIWATEVPSTDLMLMIVPYIHHYSDFHLACKTIATVYHADSTPRSMLDYAYNYTNFDSLYLKDKTWYISGSLQQIPLIKDTARILIDLDLDAWFEWIVVGASGDLNLNQYGRTKDMTIREIYQTKAAVCAFNQDMSGLLVTKKLLMVEPCGVSAHIEAGLISGLKGKVIYYQPNPSGDISPLYKDSNFFMGIAFNRSELRTLLGPLRIQRAVPSNTPYDWFAAVQEKEKKKNKSFARSSSPPKIIFGNPPNKDKGMPLTKGFQSDGTAFLRLDGSL